MTSDFHDWIDRHIAGTLTEEEWSLLQSALGCDQELRRLYLDHMNLDAALASHAASEAGTRELITASATSPPRRWFQRPVLAAAIGLVFGLCTASLVYGIVVQRRADAQVVSQLVLSEGFENEALPRDRGLPRRPDVWGGDLWILRGSAAGVVPAEGQSMAVLPPVEKRKFSYASRFLDVSGFAPAAAGASRRLEVTARFHGGPAGNADRFQIRLAAFAEDVAGARAIWIGGSLDEQALVHVARTVKPDPDPLGWTTVRSAIDLPAGARVVLISLAACVADENAAKTEHYLDDVQVRLVTRDGAALAPAVKH